jgi:4'-phosphopantetheinyl transferase
MVDARQQGGGLAELAPAVLSTQEQRRAAAFIRWEDKESYIAAHVVLRVILGAQLNLDPAQVQLIREACPGCGGPHGRPAVLGNEVHFSLSHSGPMALLACASKPVGVDVEAVPSPEMAEKVGPALHPDEAAELAALPHQYRPAAVARAWVRKEAYLKGIGIGLARDVSLDYVGTDQTPTSPMPEWVVRDVHVPAEYAAALAITAAI